MKFNGTVTHLFRAPSKGAPIESLGEATLLVAKGMQGDRNADGNGRWNSGNPGKRQLTIISLESFAGTGFEPIDSRRNIVVQGGDINRLINSFFKVGDVRMRGAGYCYPCPIIDKLCGKTGFAEKFRERGGIIVEVWDDGCVRVGDPIVSEK
jgi:MOSC domain-containing protein YiiM